MVTEMKKAFDKLISRLHKAEEIISEVEDIPVEFSKTKKKSKQRMGIKNRMGCQTIKGVAF